MISVSNIRIGTKLTVTSGLGILLVAGMLVGELRQAPEVFVGEGELAKRGSVALIERGRRSMEGLRHQTSFHSVSAWSAVANAVCMRAAGAGSGAVAERSGAGCVVAGRGSAGVGTVSSRARSC